MPFWLVPYEPFIDCFKKRLSLLARILIENGCQFGIGSLVVCDSLKETLSHLRIFQNVEFMSAQKIDSHCGKRFNVNEPTQAHGVEMRKQFYFAVSGNSRYMSL
jgi:hypothetical protein